MTAHDILGKRYEFTQVDAPDFVIVSFSTTADDCAVYFRDGLTAGRQHLRLSVVMQSIRAGALIESAAAPFTVDTRKMTGR